MTRNICFDEPRCDVKNGIKRQENWTTNLNVKEMKKKASLNGDPLKSSLVKSLLSMPASLTGHWRLFSNLAAENYLKIKI